MSKYLMSPPDYFQVEYIINPWMQQQVGLVNVDLAKQQWQQLYEVLQQYADVELVAAAKNRPDLVFTANAGLVKNNKVVISHFACCERQPEEPLYKAWFDDHDYEVIELPNTLCFEGAGDGLFQPNSNRLWLGHGFRSQPKAAIQLSDYFQADIVPLKLVDPRFYHLDTCFCPLMNDRILYYPNVFDAESKQLIEELVPSDKRIAVATEDAEQFACNAIAIDDAKGGQPIIVMNSASEPLQQQLNDFGYQAVITPTSEFLRAGGATKCMTLQLDNN